MRQIDQITIVGCGLLGGSLALAMRRAGYQGRITVCGGSRGPQLAVERGIAEAIETSFARQEICQSDFLFLAAPIGGIIDFLKKHGKQIKAGALVTDAGSTKVEICQIAQEALLPEADFVGGHPMAGSEHSGIEYARADLFEGATWALMESAPAAALQELKVLIERIGARPLLTNPVMHDQAVAMISHLPQLVASSLAYLLNEENSELKRRLAATGWRDMTRLAGSSWSVWRDIVLTNQPNISASLGSMIDALQTLKDALDTRDFNRVRELFTAANDSVEKQRALHYQPFKKI